MAAEFSVNAQKNERQLERVMPDSVLAIEAGLHWLGEDCRFDDWRFFPRYRVGFDQLPQQLQDQLCGLRCGDLISRHFIRGELLPTWQRDRFYTMKRNQFQPRLQKDTTITPAIGRFYPASWFSGFSQLHADINKTGRVITIDNQHLSVDFNHPLAGKDIDITLRIESIQPSDSNDGRPPEDILALLSDDGPGMQNRISGQETEFWQNNPFHRLDEAPDGEFFNQPSFQPFWDKTALLQVSRFYHQQVTTHSRLLDLMAGVHSPLAEADVLAHSVCCAGLNQLELDHNPICDQSQVLDVNRITHLPYTDASFDAVLIHAAFEYVVDPGQLLAEIQRILRPEGQLIISYTDRFVVEKAVRCWSMTHAFERMGLLLAYLRNCHGLGQFQSQSWRGRHRPSDDALAKQLKLSDPVFIISAKKSASS